MSKLYIVRGIPGSGKSTYAKSLGVAHFEADMYFMHNGEYKFNRDKLGAAHEWCQTLVRTMLSVGADVVVSNTFTTLKEMQPYLDMAETFGAEVEMIEVKTQYGSIHNVPEETLEKMKARWQDTPSHLSVKVIS